MPPNGSGNDFPDMGRLKAVHSCDLAPWMGLGLSANCSDLIFGQDRGVMPLAPRASIMLNLVCEIFGMRSPAEMVRVHTAFVAIAARMSGLMFRSWRLAVSKAAHDAVRLLRCALVCDLAPTVPVEGERPDQAFIPLILNVGQKPRKLLPVVPRRPKGERAPAMLLDIVPHAQPESLYRVVTAV